MGDETIRKAHHDKFVSAVGSRFRDVRGRRLAEAASHVNELLYSANVGITQVGLLAAYLVTSTQSVYCRFVLHGTYDTMHFSKALQT